MGFFKKIRLSLRNLLYYRQTRMVSKQALQRLKESADLDDVRTAMSAIVLESVGLRLNGDPIHWVYLTKTQTAMMQEVAGFGYKVGL